jgi:predicted DNA-binding transcriptional regulator YafY
MNRLDRLLALTTVLQSKRYVTAEYLAERFGMSVRTVYRDIKALCDSGVPVSFEPAKGYFLVPGFFLPPVSFTTEEAAALLLLEGAAQVFADQSIRDHYTTALTKVRSVLRGPQKEHLDTLASRIHIQFPERMATDFSYLASLQQCITDRTVLEIGYKNVQGEESLRCVEPIGLIFYAFSWHVVGWCYKREAYRDFRVSRIATLRCTGKPFRKKDHIELSDYMKELPVAY